MARFNYLLFISIMFLGLIFVQNNIYADDSEPIRIETNKEYTENKAYDAVNKYAFTLLRPGRILLRFKHANIPDCLGKWFIELRDANLGTIIKLQSEAADIDLFSDKIGVPAGNYNLEVSGVYEIDYKISVQYAEGDFFEKEFNDSISTANEILINKEYTGNITEINGYLNEDYYKFSLTKPGRVKINLKHSNIANDIEIWRLYVIDELSNVLSDLFSKGTDINLTSGGIGLPGGTYYLKIDNPSFAQTSNVDYQLTVQLTEGDNYEMELNNSISTANQICVGKEYTGNFMNERDVDYYKFTLSNPAKVKIDLKHANRLSEYIKWEVVIMDELSNELLTFDSKGTETNKITNGIGLPLGNYYIKIVGQKQFDNNCEYIFSLQSVEGAFFEKEINNSMSTATIMGLGQEYIGNIDSSNDLDLYAFTVAKPMKSKIVFSHNNIANPNNLWFVNVFDENSNKLLDFSSKGTEVVMSSKEITFKPGKYFIKVYSSPWQNNNSDYKLKIMQVK